MNNNVTILQLFSTLDSQKSLNKLVEVSFSFALHYIRLSYKKFNNVLVREGLTINDLAIDSIAPLFSVEKNKNEISIITSFNNWQPPIETEQDALFFLNKLIQKRVEQHVSLLMREADPFFARLMDSVNYLVKKYGFKKLNYFGTVYIVEAGTTEIDGKVIQTDQFNLLPAFLFNDRKNFLQNLFEHISKDSCCFPAIPFNLLIYKLKELNTSLYRISESTEEQNDLLEIDTVVNSALEETFLKLNKSYLEKEKLLPDEFEIFKKTLADLAEDLKNGGINPGLYKYLSVYFTELDEITYKQKYHNILEYLLKLLKQKIAERLME